MIPVASAPTETRSTCPYCGVGCGVIIESQGRQITGVRGDPDHPANFGRLCTKGAALHLSTSEPARLLHPELRDRRDAARRRCHEFRPDWIGDRFAQDPIDFRLCGRIEPPARRLVDRL